MRASRVPHSNFALAAVAVPCSISVLSRFALAVCASPSARCAYADPHNVCSLPHWVFVPIWGSIGPVLWAPMLDAGCCAHVCARINAHRRSPTPITYVHCSNECLYQFGPSRLAAYAGCVMLWTRLRAQRSHQCALATADPHSFCPLFQ
jgi:hypothetical protein